MGSHLVLLIAPCAYGLVCGFNDGGSLLGSFMAGRVISPRAAMALLLLTALGPLLVGTQVARTVAFSIIDLTAEGIAGYCLITAVCLVVVVVSWSFRVPTSVTLALAGSMVGWALAGDVARIHWPGVLRVVLGTPISVLAGAGLSFLIYRTLRRLLSPVPYARALSLARFQHISAGVQAVAYGSNDMEKTIGLVTVAGILAGHGVTLGGWVPVAIGFLGFLVGALAGGWGLARRLGFGVFRARPVQAMGEQLGGGLTVTALSLAGAPISSSQTINGSFVGVGVAVRAAAIRWGVVREMLFSWLLTLPLALAGALVLHGALRLVGLLP